MEIFVQFVAKLLLSAKLQRLRQNFKGGTNYYRVKMLNDTLPFYTKVKRSIP